MKEKQVVGWEGGREGGREGERTGREEKRVEYELLLVDGWQANWEGWWETNRAICLNSG